MDRRQFLATAVAIPLAARAILTAEPEGVVGTLDGVSWYPRALRGSERWNADGVADDLYLAEERLYADGTFTRRYELKATLRGPTIAVKYVEQRTGDRIYWYGTASTPPRDLAGRKVFEIGELAGNPRRSVSL